MYYIGVDLGGTNIAAGIVNEKGDIFTEKRENGWQPPFATIGFTFSSYPCLTTSLS